MSQTHRQIYHTQTDIPHTDPDRQTDRHTTHTCSTYNAIHTRHTMQHNTRHTMRHNTIQHTQCNTTQDTQCDTTQYNTHNATHTMQYTHNATQYKTHNTTHTMQYNTIQHTQCN